MPPTTAEKSSKPVLSYTAFLASLRLNKISLKGASCDFDEKAFWKDEERSLAFKFSSEPFKIEGKHFDARAQLEVTMTGDKSKSNMVRITVAYDLYIHADEAPKEHVKKFCEGEIRLIVWPYLREFVMDLSGRMYIPPIILPLSDEKEE